ncbi:hypothetical protein D1164_04950 [Mariniphaga sediminis]|uniref:Uncharacterized protein n=1 Tax=Mariniphaga sediminis TaxID=1628158 RepID=A0A399D6A2_9BACT|nr:hypothetical protein D1164_04950 [Mariniphaga sediminis]
MIYSSFNAIFILIFRGTKIAILKRIHEILFFFGNSVDKELYFIDFQCVKFEVSCAFLGFEGLFN